MKITKEDIAEINKCLKEITELKIHLGELNLERINVERKSCVVLEKLQKATDEYSSAINSIKEKYKLSSEDKVNLITGEIL